MNIKQIEAFIKSVNLFNATISIKRDDTGDLLMAELESGGDVVDYVYATDSRFLAKISQWAIENAAGYLPEPKSHANDYYDLVADTVQAFNERIQYDRLTEDDDWADALHKVVDDAVPHYYSEIFQVMAADGLDIDFDDDGMCPDTKDVTRICQARIYEQLYNDVANDSGVVWFESEEDDE